MKTARAPGILARFSWEADRICSVKPQGESFAVSSTIRSRTRDLSLVAGWDPREVVNRDQQQSLRACRDGGK
jgi:hypothetical protein